MKVTVESTDEYAAIGGAYCRIWKGVDTKGQRVTLVVHSILTPAGGDLSEGLKDLRTVPMTAAEAVQP